MAADFPLTRVGELADSISETHKFNKEKLIFLNTSDILLGEFLHRDYTAIKDWPGQAKKSICKDDILFSEIRPANGRWAYVKEQADDYVVSTKLMVLRVKKDRLLPKFFYQFLTSSENTRWLQHLADSRSGTFPQITFDQVASLEIPLPPVNEQRAIAEVIGALDDKIELTRRMNETLEALLQTIFKTRFVDATATKLPKGWREGKVSDLATLSRDSLNPGEFPNETFDHYSIPAFDDGRTPKPDTGDTIKSNKFLVSSDCVLVSKLNPRIPRVWLPTLSGENRAICSTEFLVTTPKLVASREFLFCLFTNETFVSVFATMVTGTSGSHQRVKPESLLGMDVVIPPPSVMHNFTETTAPLLQRINHNIAESRTLAELRDALLPKLLSGELRVPFK